MTVGILAPAVPDQGVHLVAQVLPCVDHPRPDNPLRCLEDTSSSSHLGLPPLSSCGYFLTMSRRRTFRSVPSVSRRNSDAVSWELISLILTRCGSPLSSSIILRRTGAQSSLKVDTRQSGIGSIHHSLSSSDGPTPSAVVFLRVWSRSCFHTSSRHCTRCCSLISRSSQRF